MDVAESHGSMRQLGYYSKTSLGIQKLTTWLVSLGVVDLGAMRIAMFLEGPIFWGVFSRYFDCDSVGNLGWYI